MKKLLFILLGISLTILPAMAQNKQLEKARKKEQKATMKRYNKEGWKLFGSPRSMEVALLTYYDKMDKLGESGSGIVGTSTAKSKNVLHMSAINSACTKYATQAGSTLKGRLIRDLNNDADDLSVEFDRFYASYEQLVEKEIKGELKEEFSIYRELPGGGFEMESYFIVNEDAASRARLRAMENAMKESTAAQRYAQKVSEFVRKGFSTEEGAPE